MHRELQIFAKAFREKNSFNGANGIMGNAEGS
jgi:hypothetical protein